MRGVSYSCVDPPTCYECTATLILYQTSQGIVTVRCTKFAAEKFSSSSHTSVDEFVLLIDPLHTHTHTHTSAHMHTHTHRYVPGSLPHHALPPGHTPVLPGTLSWAKPPKGTNWSMAWSHSKPCWCWNSLHCCDCLLLHLLQRHHRLGHFLLCQLLPSCVALGTMFWV